MEKGSQPSRNQWWVWSRDAVKGLHQRHLLVHQKARGKPDTKVKILWVRKLRSKIEREDPLKAHTHQATRNGTFMKFGLLKSGNLMMNWWTTEWWSPVVWPQGGAHASQTRFSRDCKNVILEEANHARTVRPVVCSKRAYQFVIEDDKTESELSLESRSFLHRVNDQVRKRQNQSSQDATKDSDNHSLIFGMFMSSICNHGKELLRQLAFPQKIRRSHFATDVWHIWEIDIRTIRWDLWSENN